ncbi:MAG: hypothetical protein AAFR47_22670, partial [Pseudomonadota bacterium]
MIDITIAVSLRDRRFCKICALENVRWTRRLPPSNGAIRWATPVGAHSSASFQSPLSSLQRRLSNR